MLPIRYGVAAEGLKNDVPFASHLQRCLKRSDGLPSSWINAIVQSDDEYLWIGTDNGLVVLVILPCIEAEIFKLYHTLNAELSALDKNAKVGKAGNDTFKGRADSFAEHLKDEYDL